MSAFKQGEDLGTSDSQVLGLLMVFLMYLVRAPVFERSDAVSIGKDLVVAG